jgi:hypothetical protein
LSLIDNNAAPIIRKLEPGMTLSSADISFLIQFVALQFTRTPSFARMVRRTAEAVGNEYLQDQFGTVGLTEKALTELETITGEKRLIDTEAMVRSVREKRIHAHANETLVLSIMFEHANVIGNLIKHSVWTVLVAPQSTGFIICDHPIVTVPPANHIGPVGIVTAGALTYIPLKRRLCLRVQLGDYGFSYKQLDSRKVSTINCNIAANSERYILAADRTQLESVIERSDSATVDQRDDLTVRVFRPDAENKFTIYEKTRGKFFY